MDEPHPARTNRAYLMLRLLAAVAALLALMGWAVRYGRLGPRLPRLGGVRDLGNVEWTPWGLSLLIVFACLVGLGLVRRRLVGLERLPAVLIGGALALIGLSLTASFGHLPVLVVATAAFVFLVVANVALPSLDGLERLAERHSRLVGFGLWASVALSHAVFSIHRHWAFGSGSWDLGCMVHNVYRASRGLDTVSTVLGEVDFLGDHFMVGIYLFAPLFWVDSSAWMLLSVQAASLAVTAPAVCFIARQQGASWVPSVALGLTTGLAFGLQSAAFFDAHAITLGFGFLAAALWALEAGRLGWASASLVLFSTFKESLGAYVVGLGLLLIVRGLASGCRRAVGYGAAWVAYGAVWFVVVNRVFMPTLIARANAPEPHETFGDFGPTVFAALLGMLSDPLTAVGALFVHDEKVLSLGVTVAGTGGLALMSPGIGLAALPLFAERFLSTKATMWQMGYHYAAPLTLYAGWAAARGLSTARSALAAGLRVYAPRALRPASEVGLAVYLVAAMFVVNAFGYRHPANFHRWRESYFSSPSKRAANAAAVAHVSGMGRSVSVAAQNRILPHLADRPQIWRLGEHDRANVVILSKDESAWPYPDHFPRTLAARLEASADWRRVFEQDNTLVFVRDEPPEDRPEG